MAKRNRTKKPETNTDTKEVFVPDTKAVEEETLALYSNEVTEELTPSAKEDVPSVKEDTGAKEDTDTEMALNTEEDKLVVEDETVGEDSKACKDIKLHVATIEDALSRRPVNSLDVASTHYGFITAVRATFGKEDGITLKELEEIFKDNQEVFNPNVAYIGSLDWKWGDDSKKAYNSLISVLTLRNDGGIIHSNTLQEEFRGQYANMGTVLSSLV